MSEAPLVLLWWGDEVRLLGPSGRLHSGRVAPGEDPAAFVVRTAAAAFPAARRLRIVCHPESLHYHVVAQVAGSRRRLRRALAAEFRALEAPGCAWGVEPARPGVSETVLTCVSQSALDPLVRSLKKCGLRVEGAWSVLSLLECIPPASAIGPASLRFAAAGRQALVTSVDSGGRRHVRHARGRAWAESAAGDLRSALARLDEGGPIAALAVQDGEPEGTDGSLGELLRGCDAVELSVEDFLGHATRLVPGGSADLLGSTDFLRPFRRARAAAAAAALAAALAGIGLWRHQAAAAERQREADRIGRHARVEAEAHAARLAAAAGLKSEWEVTAWTPPPHADFLAAIAQAAAPDVEIREIECRGQTLTLRGETDASTPAVSLARFRRKLLDCGTAWSFPAPGPAQDGRFAWSGYLAAGAPPAPADSDALRSQLAEMRSQLPSAADFKIWQPALDRHWREISQSSESFPGLVRRRVVLAADRLPLDAWPAVLALTQKLCATPGVTIDTLDLAASPGSDAFDEAEVVFTARLRP